MTANPVQSSTLPEVGAPITLEWSCPTWCSVDHDDDRADGYRKHGHIVHRTSRRLSCGDSVEFWYSPIGTWRYTPDAVVRIFLPFGSPEFTRGVDAHAWLDEIRELADLLDEMNAEVLA